MLLLDSTNGARTVPSYRPAGSTGGLNAGAQPVAASTTAAEQQTTDYLVTELERLVQASGALPQDPQAMQKAVLAAEQEVASKHSAQENLDDQLTAAGEIAEVQLLAGQVKDPMAMRQSARTLLGESLIGVASNTALSAGDRANIEDLMISSNYGSTIGRGESTLGQELQIVDASTDLSAPDKATLEQQIISGRYAQSLGPGSVAFLKSYLGTIAQLKNNPTDLNTVAAATQAAYLVNFGDAAQGLSGAKLDNAIGSAMGMKPDVTPSSAQDQAALANGSLELFSGKQLDAIKTIAEQIQKVGGTDAKVTVLPVLFDAHDGKAELQQHMVWRVTTPEGKDTYVDDMGRTYSSVNDYMDHNKLGFGRMIIARDGQLSVDAQGRLSLREYDHQKGFWDYVDQYGGYVLDGAAIVGGIVLIASGLGAPVGAALEAVAWGAVLAGGAYGIYKGGSDLADRSQHGQYVGLGKETAGDYVSIAAGLAAPIGGGTTKAAAAFAEAGRPGLALFAGGAPALAKITEAGNPMISTTARVAGFSANTINIGVAGYSGYDYATNFDKMTLQQRLQGGVNIAMGGIALVGGAKNLIEARSAAQTNILGGMIAVGSNPADSPTLQPTGVDANGVPLPPTTLGRGRSWSDVARRTDGLIYRQSLANQPGSRVRPLEPSPEETAVRERLMTEAPKGSPIRFTLTTIGPEETIYGGAGAGTKRKNTFTTFAEARAVAATRGGRWVNRIVPDSGEPVPITNRRANPDEIMGAVHVDGDGKVLPVAIPNIRSIAWASVVSLPGTRGRSWRLWASPARQIAGVVGIRGFAALLDAMGHPILLRAISGPEQTFASQLRSWGTRMAYFAVGKSGMEGALRLAAEGNMAAADKKLRGVERTWGRLAGLAKEDLLKGGDVRREVEEFAAAAAAYKKSMSELGEKSVDIASKFPIRLPTEAEIKAGNVTEMERMPEGAVLRAVLSDADIATLFPGETIADAELLHRIVGVVESPTHMQQLPAKLQAELRLAKEGEEAYGAVRVLIRRADNLINPQTIQKGMGSSMSMDSRWGRTFKKGALVFPANSFLARLSSGRPRIDPHSLASWLQFASWTGELVGNGPGAVVQFRYQKALNELSYFERRNPTDTWVIRYLERREKVMGRLANRWEQIERLPAKISPSKYIGSRKQNAIDRHDRIQQVLRSDRIDMPAARSLAEEELRANAKSMNTAGDFMAIPSIYRYSAMGAGLLATGHPIPGIVAIFHGVGMNSGWLLAQQGKGKVGFSEPIRNKMRVAMLVSGLVTPTYLLYTALSDKKKSSADGQQSAQPNPSPTLRPTQPPIQPPPTKPPTLPPQPPQPPKENNVVYAVQPGDSLARIAQSHHVTMGQIFQLNPSFNPSLADGDFFTKRTHGERGRDPDLIHPFRDHIILPPANQTAKKRSIPSRSFV